MASPFVASSVHAASRLADAQDVAPRVCRKVDALRVDIGGRVRYREPPMRCWTYHLPANVDPAMPGTLAFGGSLVASAIERQAKGT
jgi:hypothetical protein